MNAIANASHAATLPGYQSTVLFPGDRRHPVGLEVANESDHEFAYYQVYVVRCALTGDVVRRFDEADEADVLDFLATLAA